LFGRAAAGPQPAAPPPQNSPVAGGDEGTGLLDLCRDSDDDALGAVLDEIKPRTERSGHEEAPELESSNVAHELKSLLSMQTAEGWISENPDELKDPVSISICRMVTDPESWEIYIEKALKLWGRRTIESSRIVQTVLFVVLLQVRFASMKDVWSRASTKAEQYLSKALGMRKSAIRSFFDDLQFQMEARGAKAVS